jgi:L-rhamnose-H+ transport protein
MVFATAPNALALYQQAGVRPLLFLIGFGIGFGLSQISFGLGLAVLGLALNFAIFNGLSTALGSLVPLLTLHSEMLLTGKGALILLGVALVLAGVAGCAVAGRLKERAMRGSIERQSEGATKRMGFKTGLIICILGGAFSSFLNFGLAFGAPLISRAAQLGVSPGSQANVIWAPLLTASLIPYAVYCAYLFKKNKSAKYFFQPGTTAYWILGTVMGVLWFGSVILYGATSAELAGLGPVLGWPLFMACIIITSNVWGIVTGEWNSAGSSAMKAMAGGIVCLILGFVALAISGRSG